MLKLCGKAVFETLQGGREGKFADENEDHTCGPAMPCLLDDLRGLP
jgi:hypothetical protein